MGDNHVDRLCKEILPNDRSDAGNARWNDRRGDHCGNRYPGTNLDHIVIERAAVGLGSSSPT
jgi:hypothetical protein